MESELSLYSLFLSQNPKRYTFRLLVVLSLAVVSIYIWNHVVVNPKKGLYEGFEQQEQYVFKRNQDAFDAFYATIYDTLYQTDEQSTQVVDLLLQETNTSKSSVILDAGCGTGSLTHCICNKGIENVTGVDISPGMVEVAKQRSSNSQNTTTPTFVVGNLETSRLFPPNTFTHIFMTGMTWYQLSCDSSQVVSNFALWLQRGGILAIQLADPDRFDPIIPAANPRHLSRTLQSYLRDDGLPRVNQSKVEIKGVSYESEWIPETKVWREKFQDQQTHHVREQEQTWSVCSAKEVQQKIERKFKLISQHSMESINGDPHQYILCYSPD